MMIGMKFDLEKFFLFFWGGGGGGGGGGNASMQMLWTLNLVEEIKIKTKNQEHGYKNVNAP